MVAIIGDIHGCYFTLVDLYNKIIADHPGIKVYTVGDLIDRGNHSYEVLQFVIENDIHFTPGNHDYMFYHFFREPTSVFARSWVFNGNESTLESYEKNEEAVFKHIDLISKAPLFYDLYDCFISHAGISVKYKSVLPPNFRDDLSILETYIYNDFKNDNGVLWTRDPLLNLGKIQLVGHTKQQSLTLDEEANALYIDTGACIGNKLSAVIVDNSNIIDTYSISTHLDDII
ncbi:MAG: metallophosphoesterase [Melioribacteraceae bacterium]|nr:metallophosphoesterase [Melioribacteraceae bacterium]MCF8355378.1 metallophosphoesterase [Melioribacteraceae bacterium]MCF8394623.1 metallophosphoesterase [Melioribacteraceae bacterium]MCF8419620.1 metallophosphoesterase [Melioribacteraceae bacterium]